MKYRQYILSAIFAIILASCSAFDTPEPADCGDEQEIFLMADLQTGEISRVGYFYDGSALKGTNGNLEATWQLGDIIKVYETDAYYPTAADQALADTDIYHDCDDYSARNPYPRTPDIDRYYCFKCVAGNGSARGVFQYMGLATATKRPDAVTGGFTVDVSMRSLQPILNWNRFQGVAVYESPMHKELMGYQSANGKYAHLKYGQRLCGHVCAHNFQWGHDSGSLSSSADAGLGGLIMRNVDNCMYTIVIGGMDAPIYGGSTISISMPLTTAVSLPEYSEPITITIGKPGDFYFGEVVCKADPDQNYPTDIEYNIVAYVNGWPGTLAANQPVVVTLTESMTGAVYTWNLSSPHEITFVEGRYYTFDLRDDQWTKN